MKDSRISYKKFSICLWLFLGRLHWGAVAAAGEEYWDTRVQDLGIDGPINTIAVRGSEVFVGGEFTRISSVNAAAIARWDGSQWRSPDY